MSESARVIVSVDGSHQSPGIVRRAVHEARRRDALLVPVTTWTVTDGDGLCLPDELRCAARKRLDEALESAFESAFEGYPEGVRIHPLVLRAEAGQGLVAAADRPDDLLVVGSGRAARHCWTHAGCEVLIVPPSEQAQAEEAQVEEPTADSLPHCHAGIGYLD